MKESTNQLLYAINQVVKDYALFKSDLDHETVCKLMDIREAVRLKELEGKEKMSKSY
jgi:hypothetical protein